MLHRCEIRSIWANIHKDHLPTHNTLLIQVTYWGNLQTTPICFYSCVWSSLPHKYWVLWISTTISPWPTCTPLLRCLCSIMFSKQLLFDLMSSFLRPQIPGQTKGTEETEWKNSLGKVGLICWFENIPWVWSFSLQFLNTRLAPSYGMFSGKFLSVSVSLSILRLCSIFLSNRPYIWVLHLPYLWSYDYTYLRLWLMKWS